MSCHNASPLDSPCKHAIAGHCSGQLACAQLRVLRQEVQSPSTSRLEDAFYSDDELAECLHAEELGLAPSPTSKASAFAASFVTTSISQHVSLHIGTGILAGWSLPEPYPLLQALELLRGDPFCPDVPARGFRNYYTAPSQLPHPRDSAALLLVALKALALCLGELGRTHLQP